MKLSISICFALGLVGFILNFKTTNPYFDSSKSHHTLNGFTNPYLESNNQKKVSVIYLK